jgi:hypothetical protein
MKKFMIGAFLATLLAAPSFAQSYSAGFGTGNMVNEPLAKSTNGRAGIGETAYSGGTVSAFAYAPNGASAYAYVPRSEHARHSRY